MRQDLTVVEVNNVDVGLSFPLLRNDFPMQGAEK